jgi:hypothetical protein
MRLVRIAWVSTALIIVPMALAELSLPKEVLGKVEGAMDFCAQADPQSASKYQAKKKEFAQGATDDELADARGSQEYKDAYKASTDELSKQSKEQGRKSCATALAGK